MENLKSELIKKTWEYVEEQAKNTTIDYIKVFMPTNEVEKYLGIEICDTNGWQGDWWYDNPIQLGGRKWDLSGCMYDGELELTLREDRLGKQRKPKEETIDIDDDWDDLFIMSI